MSYRVTGANLRARQVRELTLKLERLKKLPQVLDEKMAEMAQDVRQTARDMAPVDYGGLKQAIQIKRTAATRKGHKGFIKGKSTFYVYINPMTPAVGRAENFVGEYAWMVHEHMGYGSVPGAIMPSEKSIAAGAAKGEVAGGKFLDRAMLRHRGKISAKLTKESTKFISNLDFVAKRVDK